MKFSSAPSPEPAKPLRKIADCAALFALILQGLSVNARGEALPPGMEIVSEESRAQTRNQVQQALLYLRKSKLQAAQGLLTGLTRQEPGKSDPMVWLALGRVYWETHEVSLMDEAVTKALALGADTTADKWASLFLETYRQHIGHVLVEPGGGMEYGDWVTFDIKLTAPLFDKDRKALYNALVPDGGVGQLTRAVGRSFALPGGHYLLGDALVQVDPEGTADHTADAIGARHIVNFPARPEAAWKEALYFLGDLTFLGFQADADGRWQFSACAEEPMDAVDARALAGFSAGAARLRQSGISTPQESHEIVDRIRMRFSETRVLNCSVAGTPRKPEEKGKKRPRMER